MGAITGNAFGRNVFSSIPTSENRTSIDQQFNSAATKSNQSTDIGQAVEQQKSLSLTYQLMRAIARENGSDTNEVNASSLSVKASYEFNLDLQFDFTDDLSTSQMEQTVAIENLFSASFQFTQSSTIEINTRDPNNFTTNILIESEQQFSFSMGFQSSSNAQLERKQSDPLILNLDQSDFNFDNESRVSFDLNADGNKDSINRLSDNNVFLVFDKNANGLIDNGSELFGDTGGEVDGFQDLAQYDSNANGQIDAQDKIFSNLLLMNFDSLGNQKLQSLSSQNIESLSLNAVSKNESYSGDNLLVLESSFSRSDGSLGRVGDFLLTLN